MKLTQYAKVNSVTYKTAWNWFKAGKKRSKRATEKLIKDLNAESI